MTPLPVNHSSAVLQSLWSATRFFLPALPHKTRKEYFLVLLFYKAICDEWQEGDDALRARFPEEQAEHIQARAELAKYRRWGIPQQAHFATLAASSHVKGIGHRLNQALASLEECNPNTLKGLFGDLNFDYAPIFAPHDGDVLLHTVLTALGQAELTLRPGQFTQAGQVGQFFSELLELFMLESRPAPVLCATPLRVARMMTRLLNPKPGETIYDPACGTGALLVACAHWVRQRFANRECRLLGQDSSYDALRLARMQLVLLNMDNHRLLHGESLNVPLHSVQVDERTVLPQVDIAICHPPEILPQAFLTSLWQDPYDQFAFGLPTLDSASLGFVLHMLACLHPETGRMAALLPRSIFGNEGNDQAILKNLLNANCIDGVICLPGWLFVHPERPQVIMLLRKKRQARKLCWFDASHIAQDNPQSFERITEFYSLGCDVPGYARMVSPLDIQAGGYRWDFQP